MTPDEARALRGDTIRLVESLSHLAEFAHGQGAPSARAASEWAKKAALPQLHALDVLTPGGQEQTLALQAEARRRGRELEQELVDLRGRK